MDPAAFELQCAFVVFVLEAGLIPLISVLQSSICIEAGHNVVLEEARTTGQCNHRKGFCSQQCQW